jgi:hypothetical protein
MRAMIQRCTEAGAVRRRWRPPPVPRSAARPHGSALPCPAGRRDLRPPSEMDPRLKLRGSRATCERCHGGRDRAGFYLSVTAARSALSLACHLK